MRISLADSTMNGFKKWSDAQRPDSAFPTTANRPEPVEQHTSAVRKEAAGDGAE